MPTAHETAIELRALADSLDSQPEMEIPTLWITIDCDTKEEFVRTAKLLPKPLHKEYDEDGNFPTIAKLHLRKRTPGVWMNLQIYRSLICRMIEPAKAPVYECEPILADEELDQVSA